MQCGHACPWRVAREPRGLSWSLPVLWTLKQTILAMRTRSECLGVYLPRQGCPEHSSAICLAVNAQAVVNIRIAVRCRLPEPQGSIFFRFINLDKAVLASGGFKVVKFFHEHFSLRSFSGANG